MNFTFCPSAHCYRISIDATHRLIIPVDHNDKLKFLVSQIRAEEKVKDVWGAAIIARDIETRLLESFLQTFDNAPSKPTLQIVKDEGNYADYNYWREWGEQHKFLIHSITCISSDAYQLSIVQKSFDQIPFGEKLMYKVAERLIDNNTLKYSHRDYCGHGLEYFNQEFHLYEVWDGFGNSITSWKTIDEFVSFFAPLTDYICSGADKQFKEFYTKDAFYIANQRITRARLIEFAQM
jgi:hypothetical protein